MAFVGFKVHRDGRDWAMALRVEAINGAVYGTDEDGLRTLDLRFMDREGTVVLRGANACRAMDAIDRTMPGLGAALEAYLT